MTSARKDSRMLVYKSLHNWAKIFIHFHRAREKEDSSFGVNELRDFSKVPFREVKHSIHFSSQYECCDFRLMENGLYCWIFFFEMVYWLLVKKLDLCLNMSGFYKYIFSLIRWNQLTRKVVANGFYKYIKIYCFFLKHFITLLNVPFSFLCCHWQSTVIIFSLIPFPENIDLWPRLCMCVWGGEDIRHVCMHLFVSDSVFISFSSVVQCV